jgi:hypothetical protein
VASDTAYEVRAPDWILTYNGVDITSETSQMILGISYIDRLSAASGEVEIQVEDHQKRWQSSWYPVLGDQLNLQIGYRSEPLFNCGDFQLDELELGGPPDAMRLRYLASYITPAMRTRNTVGYENQTIAQIAQSLASKYGLGFIAAGGSEEDEIGFERITQRLETDLEFLKRLAIENGYDFAFRISADRIDANNIAFGRDQILIQEPDPANLWISESVVLRPRYKRAARGQSNCSATDAKRRRVEDCHQMRERNPSIGEGGGSA